MIRTKIHCDLCGQLISVSNMSKHLRRHKLHPETFIKENKVYKPRIGFNNKGRKAWNKGLTKETDERVLKGGQTYHMNHLKGLHDYSHNKHSEETKEKIRKQKLELCAKQGTNLCGKGLRGYYKGYYCQSSWELAYVVYSLEHNVKFVRNKKGFTYKLDGLQRTYFPDFYIPSTDTYIEIKGYYDSKTKEKEKQFNGKLVIYKKEEMKPILNYVISKYGKDFVKLYK